MTNKKSTKMTALLIALVLITSLFMGVTIARYVTTTSSEDSARVAVWGINEGGTEMDLFNATYTADDGTVIALADDGDNIIAPGTSRTSGFKILTSSAIEPEVMYEVKITVDDSEVADDIKDHPGIQWRVDENEWGTWEDLQTQIKSLVGNESGIAVFAPGTVSTELANGVTHTISWQWLMDSGYDEEDTRLGNKAVHGDISAKVVVEITARQTDVDSTGMLEGNGSVYNTNDSQPLTFRADADFSTFSNIEVDGTEVNPNNYEKEEGSIKIKLKKEYLQTLSKGDHKITINTTDDRAIESKFTVTDSMTIAHNGIIPEGGKYYSGIDIDIEFDEIGEPINPTHPGEYEIAEKVYTTGEKFPAPQTGDVYVYGDYEYCFNAHYNGMYNFWQIDENLNGWGVYYKYPTPGYTVVDSAIILTTINNKNTKSLRWTFANYNSPLYLHVIPETTEYIDYMLYYGSSFIIPSIPQNVKSMNYAFYGGYAEGITFIDINSNKLESYSNTFKINTNTNKSHISWIRGTISESLKQDFARVNKIELVNPYTFEQKDNIPKYGKYYRGIENTDAYIDNYESEATEVFLEGNSFPTPQTGDIYICSTLGYSYGTYEYRYNMRLTDNYMWVIDESMNGWGMKHRTEGNFRTEAILSKIANKPVVNLDYAFRSNDVCHTPIIPNTIKSMNYTFWGSNVQIAEKIPSNVESMNGTFKNCSGMTKLEIDANPSSYTDILKGTNVTKITGASKLKDELIQTK